METIDRYLTEAEARAEHAYRQAYYAEYTRVYEQRLSSDRQHVLHWAALAHNAARAARERVLRAEVVQ
ncbi:MAG: hypothetical protein M3Q29_16265 [Chloroflexota bacterium]|nr:hypothetical protein [Chloroflexota bacterium]